MRFLVVTLQAFGPARVVPHLRLRRTGRGMNRERLFETGAEQVGVAVVGAPFVDDSVYPSRVVADEEARFQPTLHVGVGLVHRHLECLDEHGAGRPRPFSGGREADLSLGHGNPAQFACAVRPEGHADVVRHEPVGGHQVAHVLEGPCLRQMSRNRPARVVGHLQERLGHDPGVEPVGRILRVACVSGGGCSDQHTQTGKPHRAAD